MRERASYSPVGQLTWSTYDSIDDEVERELGMRAKSAGLLLERIVFGIFTCCSTFETTLQWLYLSTTADTDRLLPPQEAKAGLRKERNGSLESRIRPHIRRRDRMCILYALLS